MNLNYRINGMLKRAFDIIASVTGLILLAPIFGFIAILIKRDSPGPVFYWAPRIGRSGIVFNMLKFRTMYETPRSYNGLRITCKDDDRITPLGKWLRDTKLNEFPQLWNVLIGEMSLVGPRPEDPDIARTWPTHMARELLSVRPGVTSPASILYRDEESMLQAGHVMRKYLHELSPDKMRLDQLYVQYHSFWLDLDVILWTAVLLLPRIRKYSPPEQLLFVGPVTRLIQRYVSWFLLDFLVVLASLCVMDLAVSFFIPLNINWLLTLEMALGYAALHSLMGVLLNNNVISWTKASTWESGRLTLTWLLSTLSILAFHTWYLEQFTPRSVGVILGASLLSMLGFMFVRYRGRIFSAIKSRLAVYRARASNTRERVLIVGSGRTAEHIAWLMEHPTYAQKFKVVGFIEDDLFAQGMKIYGFRVIGRLDGIQQIVKDHAVNLIILADGNLPQRKLEKFRDVSRFQPARLVVAPDIFGSLSNLDDMLGVPIQTSMDDFRCQYCMARFNHHADRKIPVEHIIHP